MTNQHFFNQVCSSLEQYGNPYGSQNSRNWGWINPNNPNERCAIARFIKGNTAEEVVFNLGKTFCKTKNASTEEIVTCVYTNSLVRDVMDIFDYAPEVCNDKDMLHRRLQSLADKYGLTFNTEVTTNKHTETV